MVPRMPRPPAGLAMFGLAARLLRTRRRPEELQTVLRGLPHNVTTEMDLRLWRTRQQIRRDDRGGGLLRTARRDGTGRALPVRGPAGGHRQTGLAGFLATYGHRAVAEIDLGVPRWSDDPTHILGVLANYLRLDGRSSRRTLCSPGATAKPRR